MLNHRNEAVCIFLSVLARELCGASVFPRMLGVANNFSARVPRELHVKYFVEEDVECCNYPPALRQKVI
jgi:hypothetical protein